MVYLYKNLDEQTLFFPKNYGEIVGIMTLTLISNINNTEYRYIVDNDNSEPLFYKVTIAPSDDMQLGEYHYILSDQRGTISDGLLIYKGSDMLSKEYVLNKEYEQYGE